MADGLTLENVGRRRVDLQLDHDAMCGNGPCSCVQVPRARLDFSKSGKGHRVERLRCPSVLTLLPGESATALPDGSPITGRIRRCGDFRSNQDILRLR